VRGVDGRTLRESHGAALYMFITSLQHVGPTLSLFDTEFPLEA